MFKTLRRLKIYDLKQEYLNAYSNFGFNNEDSYLSAIGHGNLPLEKFIIKLTQIIQIKIHLPIKK